MAGNFNSNFVPNPGRLSTRIHKKLVRIDVEALLAADPDAYVVQEGPRGAFVGQEGAAYQQLFLTQDNGGFSPGPHPVTMIFCSPIEQTVGCELQVGQLCLQCVGDDGAQLCEP